MSVRVLKSPATSRNSEVQEIEKAEGETNMAWLGRVLTGQVKPRDDDSVLVLLGGNDPLSFRLRVAQSHVRHDLSPSAWSHVAFVKSLAEHVAEAHREGFLGMSGERVSDAERAAVDEISEALRT